MSSDLPTFSEPYTDASATTFIIMAMDKYEELKDLSNLKSLHTLSKTLGEAYFTFERQRKLLCKIMMKKNYVRNTSEVIEGLMKRGYVSSDEVWLATFYIYKTLWNFCDFDQEIATAIIDTKIPKLLVKNILHKPYLDHLSNQNNYFLIKSSLSIIHNVARYPGNHGPFNSNEVKEILVRLINRSNSDFIGQISMLTLAILVDETELQLLEEGTNTISALIDRIKTTQSKIDKKFEGFKVWELVNGLRCISVNDNMKKTIVKEGGIQVLLEVLKTSSNENDIEKTLATLWNLCFNKEIKGILNNLYDIRNVIKPYENHQSANIKKNYNGIIWLLDNKSQSIERVKSASANKLKSAKTKQDWKFDIFFSYSWANKPMVFNIKDELVKSKLKIWIDADQMKGSTLEAMADGIENSQIFVMAMSEAYRTSPYCRHEAEYAFSLKKPIIPLIMEYKYRPTSWLGLIMGSKTYYEFSERRVFQETITTLLKNVKDILKNSDEEVIVPTDESSLSLDHIDSEVECNVSSSDISSNVKNWSKEDVGKWLSNVQLSDVKSMFSDMDGILLNSMIQIRIAAPDFLYQTLKTDFGMKLIDILRFNAALEDISPK